jgi:uncharacterized membrane protein YjjP (DUF1212 family)
MSFVAGGSAELQSFLVRLGAAMNAGGQSVDVVEDRLRTIADTYGNRSVRVNALPTSLLITMGHGEPVTLELTTPLSTSPRLDQVAAVDQLTHDALRGAVTPVEGLRRLDEIQAMPPRFGPVAVIIGYAVMTVGIALVLRPTPDDVTAAAVFGVLVGSMRTIGRSQRQLQVLMPVLAAFVVSALSALAVKAGIASPGIRSIAASLVVFLPGAALCTAVVELGSGAMQAGSSRLVSGITDLVLLAFGVLGGIQAVGTPIAAVFSTAPHRLGPWAPWLGVLVFALGVTVADTAPPRSFPGLLLVLYAGFGAQVLANAFLGGYIGALIGAAVMTLAAYVVARIPSAMPPHAAFLPGFWLLVPGAVGLISLTQFAGKSAPVGSGDLAATVGSIIGVALGVLCGTQLWAWLEAGRTALTGLSTDASHRWLQRRKDEATDR